jgi:two-component system, cell cycle sensor histidine kinase and response regulator CckA
VGYNTGIMSPATGAATVFLAAMERLSLGVATTDSLGNVTWANAAFAQLTECTPETLLGQSAGPFPWNELVHAAPTSKSWFGAADLRLVSGGFNHRHFCIATIRNAADRVDGFWITERDVSEVESVVPAPQEAEASLSALIESTDDLIWSVDPHFKLITFNRAFRDHLERIFGVRAEVGMGPYELLTPAAAVTWPPLFERAFSEGAFRQELPISDGRTLELSFNPIRRDGRTVAVSIFGKDISERKTAEKALRKFATLFRCSPAVVILADVDANDLIVDVNEAFERTTGYRRDEVIGRTSKELDLWADASEYAKSVELLRKTGGLREFEFLFRRKTGEIGMGVISSELIELDGRQYVLSASSDISGMKQAEAALQRTIAALAKAELHARRLFNSLSDAVLVFQMEGDGLSSRFIDVNDSACRFLGHTRSELLQMRLVDIDPPENHPDAPDIIRHLMAEGNVTWESCLVASDGRRLPVEINTHVFDLDGTPTMISSVRDIADRKHAEQELQAIANTMPGVVFHFYANDDGSTGMSYLSERSFDFSGTRPEPLADVMQRFAATLHPDDQPRFAASIQESIRTMSKWEFEGRFTKPSGEEVLFKGLSDAIRREHKTVWAGILLDITEQKRAEEAIRLAQQTVAKTELHYQHLFNSVSDSIFIHKFTEDGLPGCYSEVNDNACRHLGYSREELLQMGPLDVDPPEEHAEIPFRARKLLADGHLLWEGSQVRKDGQRIPVEVNTHIVQMDGCPTIISSVRDISERLRAAEELRESNEQHHTILQAAMDGFCLASAEGVVLTVNEAYCRMSGYTAEELRGMRIDELEAVEARSDYLGHMQKIVSGGQDFFESRHRRKDGSVFDVEVAVQYRPSIGGQFVCFLRDITERKRAEAALRDSENLLSASQKVAGLGSYVLDIPTGRWSSSAVMDDIFGIDQTFGRSLEDWVSLVHPDWQQLAIDHFKNHVLAGRNRFDLEYKIVRRNDGATRWVHGLGELSFDSAGEPLRMFGTILDISGRKREEAEKARLEEQLRQAQKLESVGRLAGGVAHDFNNLLTVINGFSAMLLNDLKVSDPSYSYVLEIMNAGDRAASLTKQLLAFSRKQMIDPRVFDLNQTIRQLTPMLQRLIGEDILLKTHLDDSSGTVLADPDQIHQVLMNLAANARDAMRDGGRLDLATTSLELDSEAALAMHPDIVPGRYVLMTVTDTGHGIDEPTRQQIFEPFFTTKGVGQGTGLGLATVYGIIRQSRGWIDVVSQVGIGTSFKVYLPQAGEPDVPEDRGMETATETGSETILLVEDQPQVRAFAVAALRHYGYRVIEASNGDEALDAAARHSGEIQLLVTDIVMPGMNGIVLAERLTQVTRTLKTLFISGHAADAFAERGVLERDAAFLDKPFSPDALAQKVREVLATPGNPASS